MILCKPYYFMFLLCISKGQKKMPSALREQIRMFSTGTSNLCGPTHAGMGERFASTLRRCAYA